MHLCLSESAGALQGVQGAANGRGVVTGRRELPRVCMLPESFFQRQAANARGVGVGGEATCAAMEHSPCLTANALKPHEHR